jgi:hypothetical protein
MKKKEKIEFLYDYKHMKQYGRVVVVVVVDG